MGRGAPGSMISPFGGNCRRGVLVGVTGLGTSPGLGQLRGRLGLLDGWVSMGLVAVDAFWGTDATG